MKYTTKKFGAKQCHERTYENGARVFISYATPVACFIPGRGAVRTTFKHSQTTSKQTNIWARDEGRVDLVPQSEITDFFHLCEFARMWGEDYERGVL